ncbi:MAG TPA: LysM peptidoglycan-binding domain-containing protein, partial [Saprospiraceae bacterium]|nr:LysM peptidoglycan-binding domain-containing protein [Saprospiraceae bacterium]
MKKANIITFVFLLFILQGFSQENGKYFVKFTQNQEIEIEINLSEFGSVYQMSKVFQTSIEHILSYNEIKDVGTLQPNQIIKIRVDKNKVSNQKSTNALALYYKVQEGETLYRIARTYMNQDINQFIDRNKLTDHNLKKDAVLFLGYLNSNTSNNSVLAQKPVVEETLLDSTRTDLITIPEITYVKQKGIAFVQD